MTAVVALIRFQPLVGDQARNAGTVIDYSRRAAALGASLVIFGQFVLEPADAIYVANPTDRQAIEQLSAEAATLDQIVRETERQGLAGRYLIVGHLGTQSHGPLQAELSVIHNRRVVLAVGPNGPSTCLHAHGLRFGLAFGQATLAQPLGSPYSQPVDAVLVSGYNTAWVTDATGQVISPPHPDHQGINLWRWDGPARN
jgi:predicted amidohydrolase